MDFEILHPLMTVIMFCVFVSIVMWAWNDRQRERFEAAARLVLDDEASIAQHAGRDGSGRQ
jgi:cbb3-type cytochrome oxidase subunit 3